MFFDANELQRRVSVDGAMELAEFEHLLAEHTKAARCALEGGWIPDVAEVRVHPDIEGVCRFQSCHVQFPFHFNALFSSDSDDSSEHVVSIGARKYR